MGGGNGPKSSGELDSFAKLHANAPVTQVHNGTSLHAYFGAAANLLTQSRVYEKEENEESAYILLLRYVNLVLYTLTKHKDYHEDKYRALAAQTKRECERALGRLEELKVVLRAKFAANAKKREEEEEREQAQVAKAAQAVPSGSTSTAADGNSGQAGSHQWVYCDTDDAPDGQVVSQAVFEEDPEPRDEEDKNAQDKDKDDQSPVLVSACDDDGDDDAASHASSVEVTINDAEALHSAPCRDIHCQPCLPDVASRKSLRDTPSPPSSAKLYDSSVDTTVMVPPPSHGSTGNVGTEAAVVSSPVHDKSTVNNEQGPSGASSTTVVPDEGSQSIHAPPVYAQPTPAPPQQQRQPEQQVIATTQAVMPAPPTQAHNPSQPTTNATASIPVWQQQQQQRVPPVPGQARVSIPAVPRAAPTPAIPWTDPCMAVRPPRQMSHLRRVRIYGGMMSEFLGIAEQNTLNNIETCGILCGTLKDGMLFVNALVIPKQSGTSDSCSTSHEEELTEFQISSDLLTLGWIHTHPTQSCFMSSVDLHTHFSYQSMLPEAIAIVMAPAAMPNFGIFSVTDPEGVSILGNCKRTGFHAHPPQPVYSHCTHVELDWTQSPYTIHDLRSIKSDGS
eukprot:TRINITY_DN18503_c0_g1_i1.p1 TRINITY_DN18503_c0_g1~~TRINITY_DN18503_c0_g1_i1.p1  ORF type:complete len:618 (-),score=124.67 TRINITY_DN18503_c0_g1_i1:16-1869(-)